MKILLIENDPRLKTKLTRLLRKKRHETCCAESAEQGLDEMLSGIYEAVILNIALPGGGLDILRQIRRARLSVPVLALSPKCEVSDRVRALDSGADDFLELPFADAELLARLNAVTRRTGNFIFDDLLRFSGLSLNLGTYELSEGESSVALSNREMAIMKLFFLHGGNVVGKEELMTSLWGFETAAENNLEVYISYLRRKLSSIGSGTRILCIKNVGYHLAAPEPEQ